MGSVPLIEFVNLAKSKPGHVTFASASTSQLVSTEMLPRDIDQALAGDSRAADGQ